MQHADEFNINIALIGGLILIVISPIQEVTAAMMFIVLLNQTEE